MHSLRRYDPDQVRGSRASRSPLSLEFQTPQAKRIRLLEYKLAQSRCQEMLNVLFFSRFLLLPLALDHPREVG